MLAHVPQLVITGVFKRIKTSVLMFIPQLKETEKKHLLYSISADYHWGFSGNQNMCINVYSTVERNQKEAYSILFYKSLVIIG